MKREDLCGCSPDVSVFMISPPRCLTLTMWNDVHSVQSLASTVQTVFKFITCWSRNKRAKEASCIQLFNLLDYFHVIGNCKEVSSVKYINVSEHVIWYFVHLLSTFSCYYYHTNYCISQEGCCCECSNSKELITTCTINIQLRRSSEKERERVWHATKVQPDSSWGHRLADCLTASHALVAQLVIKLTA